MGYGTEKAEEQIEQLLSGISCRRLDLDSTSRKYSALQILEDFRRGTFNVLLGTQMVAKGHDIPGVQMVGVISADSILNRPVYLAAEQAFILITQCAGRMGGAMSRDRSCCRRTIRIIMSSRQQYSRTTTCFMKKRSASGKHFGIPLCENDENYLL